jgi:hypothetical protein
MDHHGSKMIKVRGIRVSSVSMISAATYGSMLVPGWPRHHFGARSPNGPFSHNLSMIITISTGEIKR